MDVRFWREACEHFSRLLELPAEERAAYLKELDADLRRGVESLMAAEAEADDFLEEPALSPGAAEGLKAAADREHSLRLGPYRLERELSVGAMSRVFLARRDDGEYEKRVAVKIIAQERASEDLVARFRRERQILAALDHPNVARLLDGGSTDEGLPYLVMEYVEGTPIDEYCDRERLTVRERLELFLDVCAAVDCAHEKGVVHRDLKPANILVDDAGAPKLLDFGIAKLLEGQRPRLDGHGTSPGARPMTPYYASPEQITGDPISRATDVYSLGVVLYRLLAGRLPYRVGEGTAEAVKLAVLQQPPTGLPAAVDAEGSAADPSSARRTTPEALRRELGGDLDGILQVALRKEPERRYDTARELEQELRRYLDGLPVKARGDGVPYRARKFVRRNRVRLATAAIVAVAIVAALGTWLRTASVREERARLAREQEQAEEIMAFLERMYQLPTSQAGRRDVQAEQILELGGLRAIQLVNEDPELAAALMERIGQMYQELGREGGAVKWLSSAAAIEAALAGADEEEPGTWWAGLRLAAAWSALRNAVGSSEAPARPDEPLTVSVSGDCPEGLTWEAGGVTPGAAVMLVYSRRKAETRYGRGPCPALELGIEKPGILAVTLADEDGRGTVEREMPPAACRGVVYVEALDLATCEPSGALEVVNGRIR